MGKGPGGEHMEGVDPGRTHADPEVTSLHAANAGSVLPTTRTPLEPGAVWSPRDHPHSCPPIMPTGTFKSFSWRWLDLRNLATVS